MYGHLMTGTPPQTRQDRTQMTHSVPEIKISDPAWDRTRATGVGRQGLHRPSHDDEKEYPLSQMYVNTTDICLFGNVNLVVVSIFIKRDEHSFNPNSCHGISWTYT